MGPRRKLLLTLVGLALAPLLLLAAFNYWTGLRTAEETLHRNQDRDIAQFTNEIGEFLALSKNELTKLSRARALVQYLESPGSNNDSSSSLDQPSPAGTVTYSEVQALVASVLNSHTHISRISVFKNSSEPLFLAEQREFETYQPVEFRTKDFPTTQPKPDSRVWTSEHPDVFSSPVSVAPFGSFMLFTAPVFGGENEKSLAGALVAEVRLDPVFSDAARADTAAAQPSANMFIILDRSGKVLYHTNEEARKAPLNESMPNFLPVANQMLSSERGRTSFVARSNGRTYATTYSRLPALDAFVARASDQDLAMAEAHRNGRLGILVAILLGSAAAITLARYWRKEARGIQRVSEGVEAMAHGKLDHRIDLRSRDDLRPIADNLEVMTRQLREQLAREAETREFQSFVRLSAILTHDLKNAIEALSLTVSNMERHSENAEFRVEAMKTLRDATNDLRTLVARLSSPVTTLSGEHKLPQKIDLVPVLRRVISKTAIGGPHEVKLELPDSLFALVDVERIDRVIENLIINAREAMAGKAGTITVAGGFVSEGQPFFSVSDTGEGMSQTFVDEQLFRPFATTKRRGVGLGLYTCREVIRANGGSIDVDSQPGVGTTFLVVLPSPPTDKSRETVLRTHHRG
ncbi:MAG TPA: ATP-binding protein [Pyrinomonadaceae bacterium]|nr:ATP-binding protein [Pyrinomonadaceae bacterium]